MAVYSDELRESIYAAVQAHGLELGIDKGGVVPLNRWQDKVKGDGYSMPDINQMTREGCEPYNHSLMALAEVFRGYDFKIDGVLMPIDYFVSVLVHGNPQPLTDIRESVERPVTKLAWLKKELMTLTATDRLSVLGWFLNLIGQNFDPKAIKL